MKFYETGGSIFPLLGAIDAFAGIFFRVREKRIQTFEVVKE